ncbi:hypothetical protein QJS10_CPB18g01793 [Acorus calamus]|uniref:Uncharacterized protein n=1 Tax=Acorus calamus TaxID=4465 RepID=A0AAV9CLD9_ACOCL|nr:hypothetical protein QJS10_CPB18g01793 [Acorus calamus]
MAAMAAHAVLAAPAPPPSHVSPHLLRNSFAGQPLSFARRSPRLSAAASRSLTIVSETKKAVAVLKGNSRVEGVVTLLQEDDGVAEATIVDNQGAMNLA